MAVSGSDSEPPRPAPPGPDGGWSLESEARRSAQGSKADAFRRLAERRLIAIRGPWRPARMMTLEERTHPDD